MFDQIPWRVQAAALSLGGAISAFFVTGLVTGSYRSLEEFRLPLLFAVLTGLFSHRGLRRSPAVIRARLKELFRASDEPDLVEITGILADTGEHELFTRHRNTVERFMRGMMTETEFHGAMRALVFEK